MLHGTKLTLDSWVTAAFGDLSEMSASCTWVPPEATSSSEIICTWVGQVIKKLASLGDPQPLLQRELVLSKLESQ